MPDVDDMLRYSEVPEAWPGVGVDGTLNGKPFRYGNWDPHEVFNRQDWVLKMKMNGNEMVLANEGLVINFDGGVDPIPARYIQLTRGLMTLGALQALSTKKAGIVPLADGPQREYVSAVDSELSATGESLANPRF